MGTAELEKAIKRYVNNPKVGHRRAIQNLLPSFIHLQCAKEIQQIIVNGIENKVPILRQAHNLRRHIKHCPELFVEKSGIPLFAAMKRKMQYIYETKISFTLGNKAEIDFRRLKNIHTKKRVLGFDVWTTILVNADNIDQAKERLEKYNEFSEFRYAIGSSYPGVYNNKSYFLTMREQCNPRGMTWEIVSQF